VIEMLEFSNGLENVATWAGFLVDLGPT
jgi:hypothetical protein